MQSVDRDFGLVFEHIEALQAEIVAALCRLVDIPSVSGDHDAAEIAAAAVVDLCVEAGFSAETWDTPGSPAVFAEIEAPRGAPVLLLYGHYDVQPPEPLDAWESPPFTATVRDGAVYGRGAGDNKGQFLAHVFAIRALRETVGCPIGVKLLVDGEEESGSPHLAALVTDRRARLDCDVAVTADGPFHAAGHPLIILGVRGLLYLEVSAQGAARDLHSGSNGGIAPTPARTLARGLASLWAHDDRVAVPGFYDDVVKPTDAEQRLADELAAIQPSSEEDVLRQAAAWKRLMFEPNVNISGMFSGYGGAGVKTVIPHHASAKIDVRLVADQDPDMIFRGIRQFLAPAGLETQRLASVAPSRTPLENPFVAPARRALRAAWSRPPHIQPCLGGTTPDFVFTRLLGVPSLLVPYAPPDMHHHAPNERMDLAALQRGVRTSAAICLELAAARRSCSI